MKLISPKPYKRCYPTPRTSGQYVAWYACLLPSSSHGDAKRCNGMRETRPVDFSFTHHRRAAWSGTGASANAIPGPTATRSQIVTLGGEPQYRILVHGTCWLFPKKDFLLLCAMAYMHPLSDSFCFNLQPICAHVLEHEFS